MVRLMEKGPSHLEKERRGGVTYKYKENTVDPW